MHAAAEGPGEPQPAVAHAGVDLQQMPATLPRRRGQTSVLWCQPEERALGHAPVELAEVVEDDLRQWMCGEPLLRAKGAQEAMPNPLPGDAPQLLLHLPE